MVGASRCDSRTGRGEGHRGKGPLLVPESIIMSARHGDRTTTANKRRFCCCLSLQCSKHAWPTGAPLTHHIFNKNNSIKLRWMGGCFARRLHGRGGKLPVPESVMSARCRRATATAPQQASHALFGARSKHGEWVGPPTHKKRKEQQKKSKKTPQARYPSTCGLSRPGQGYHSLLCGLNAPDGLLGSCYSGMPVCVRAVGGSCVQGCCGSRSVRIHR